MSKYNLPPELILYIFTFYNPYKLIYKNNVIMFLQSKFTYNSVIKEMRQYYIYNNNRKFLYFAIDSILTRVCDR